MADRVKSREELQKELAELWAASKQPAAVVASFSSREQLQQAQQQQQGQNSTPSDAQLKQEAIRRSSEKRKISTDRSSSEANKTSKGSEGCGSQDSAAGLWSTHAVPKCDLQRHSCSESDGRPCLRWLPFKAVASILRRHPGIWITTLLLFLALSTAGIIGVVFIAANETHQRRLSAEGFAINAAVAFERQLAQMFFPLLSLATIIRHDPYYPRFNKTFDGVAKELMDEMPTQGAVTNLIAAPQGVLRNFYPLSGYCQDRCNDININLFQNPERREVALKTVKDGRLLMQGPMMLSQGYFGVVGRQPVYIANSTANETFGAPDGMAYDCDVCWNETTKTRFWGFVNAVINLQSLVNGQDSRLQDLKVTGYRYEMYKFEKNGTRVEIARSSALPVDPVRTGVQVPGGQWHLTVSPEQGWVPVWRAPILAVVVLMCCLFSLLLGAILVSYRLQAWLQAANDALAREKERMDVLLARQHNLISCVLQGTPEGDGNGKHGSVQHRTLARIEDMRREIGVAQHTNGTTNGADELQLIELIDEGTYGKVFKGLWRGSVVAVKTMVLPAKMSGAEKRERMAVMEAAISSAMNHPNIVQTFTYIIKPCSTSVAQCASSQCASSEGSSGAVTAVEAAPSGNLDSPEASSAAVHNFEVSLVLEYCDWGSLRTALDAGAFFAEDNSLNYAAILDTAADVARAMLHLHKNQVLHSDLKVRNVLLKSDASGRGCIAKVADFGLAVKMDCMDTHVSAFQGTMSHMAPEALLHGHISKAADVYAYGITLWELFTGGQAYQGIPRALVGHKVAVLGLRPTLPPFTPPDFRALVEDCWAQDPEQRPSFEAILARLVRMRADSGIATTPPLQRYKLRPKVSQEGRFSSEKGVEGAAADAEAAGLLHLSSFYVNVSSSSTGGPMASPPLHTSIDGSGSINHSSGGGSGLQRLQHGSNGGSDGGSAGSGGGKNGGLYGSYRPAPRTQYMASRLYSINSTPLGPIPDTEDYEEQGGGGAKGNPPPAGQQPPQSQLQHAHHQQLQQQPQKEMVVVQQQQQQQEMVAVQQQQQQQQMVAVQQQEQQQGTVVVHHHQQQQQQQQGGAVAASVSPAGQRHPPPKQQCCSGAEVRCSTCAAHTTSSTSVLKHPDAAAVDDAWHVTLPPALPRQQGTDVTTAQQKPGRLLQQQGLQPAGGGSGCGDNWQGQPGRLQPLDVETGACS